MEKKFYGFTREEIVKFEEAAHRHLKIIGGFAATEGFTDTAHEFVWMWEDIFEYRSALDFDYIQFLDPLSDRQRRLVTKYFSHHIKMVKEERHGNWKHDTTERDIQKLKSEKKNLLHFFDKLKDQRATH